MSCFEVQILEPSGTILEIESCAGENAHNVIIEQTSSAANLTISQCMALLPSDINDIIIGQIDSHLTAGSGISLTQQSGLLRISATGLQPSGNYSIVGHQHIISDISGLQIALDNKQPSGIYASGIHNHVSLDITDFNSSVSGLLPVTDIIGGANIAVTNSGSIYTINVSGQLGLTAEQVDDRVSNLLVAGSGITLNYNDGNDTLIINTSGLQPSGNYSIVGHTHVSANISDFDSSVSGLIPVKNILSGNGINITSSFGNYTVAVTGNFGLTSEEVDDRVSNLLVAGNYITLNYNDNNNTLTINTSGLQPSGFYASGVHYHSSADITNFNSSVSGLLFPYALLDSPSFTGTPTVPTANSGTNTTQIASTAFVRTEISNLVNSAPATLDTLNELAAALGDDPNFATTIASGLSQKSNIGHTHVSSDITNFNSSVSGLLPVKNILSGTGVSVSNTSGIFTINATGSGIAADQAKALVTTVFNKTGSPIPKMTAVYINGGQGDLPTVSLAIATSDMTSAGTYGLTYEAIPNMQSGLVIVFGALTGLDTDQFNPTAPQGDVNGSVLYLSPYTSGTLTLTKPSAPNHIVAIGTVVRTHQNEGVIEVRVQNGFELEELHNVAISGASNGQFLQYNSTSGLWVPSSSGNFTTLQVNGTGVVASSGGNSGYLSKFTASNTIDNSVIYQSGNNIGIGTTNPQTLIHTSGLSTGVGSLFRLQNGSSSNNTYFETRIGTPGNFDDYIFFNRNGTNFFGATNNSELFFPNNTRVASNKPIVADPNSNAVLNLYNGSAQTELGYISGNALRFLRSYVEVARFDGSGNFGIGTTSPSGKLHIGSGDLHFDSSYGLRWTGGSRLYEERVGVAGGSTERMLYLANGDRFEVLTENGVNFIAGFHGANSLLTNSIRLYRAVGIGSNYASSGSLPVNGLAVEGSLGIGTRSPSGYLDVAGDVYVRGTGNNLGTIYIKSSASTDTSLKLRSDSQGNLFLDAGAYIKVGNQDGTAMVQGYTGPVTIGHISNSNNNQNIIFNPRATERARLTHDGNFGIGITSPSGRLHVIGSGIFSSGIVFGDNTLQTTAYVSGQAVAAPHSVSHQINGSDSIPIIIATASGITSDQHDYLLPTADIVRISGDATRSISSMVAVSGQIRTLTNVGLYDIRLLNESASGTITNRIKTSTGADIVVAPNDSISLFYDNTTQRWRTPGVVKSTNTAQLSVYEFTRSSAPPDAIGSLGSYTWSLPVGAKLVEIFMIGPGGGGASGRRGASATNRYGGGGGGSGGSVLTTIDASLIQTPITMSIGAGGAGGAAVTTNDTNGNNGGNGSATTILTFNNAVNTLFSAYVGLGATGGTNAAGTGGAFVSNNATTFRGSAGQNAALSNLTTTVPGDRAVNGPVGIPGAAGGSISTGDVIFTPGSVTNNAPYFSFNLGQAGANTSGGAASITAAGGSGSNAVSYGYGGCGGGASANGFNSGAGGNGGDGYIRITVWY